MRLIDADALLREIEEELSHECKNYTAEQNKWIDTGLRIAAHDIRHHPTVDAEPVVHGRWIETPSMAPEYECSNCGRTYEWWEVSEAHYCPNCGAKMDGGFEDA